MFVAFAALSAHAQTEVGLPVLPIDLTTALRLAGEQSPRVAAAEATARAASGELLSTYERFLPSVSAGWQLQRHEGRTQATQGEFLDVDKQSQRVGGLIAARWDFSSALFSTLSAHQRRNAAESDLKDKSLSTMLDVARAYWDLVQSSEYHRIAGRAAKVSEDLVEQSRRSVEQGIAAELDLLRDRTQLRHDLLLLDQAVEREAAASARLASLLNMDQPIRLTPIDTVLLVIETVDSTESLQSWLDRADQSHPGIAMQIAELAASRWEARRAIWGPLLPDFEAGALVTGFGPDLNDLRRSRDYSVAVRWTIGPGGLFDLGRIRSLSARADFANTRLEGVRADIMSKATMWHEAISVRGRSVSTAAGGLDDARKALEVAITRRTTGVGMALEVIDAAEALARAEREHAQAVVSYNLAQMEVLALLGDIGSATTSR
ncbi:MAG: TolC family protein [Candidatus Zixiibacteriota bacterium]